MSILQYADNGYPKRCPEHRHRHPGCGYCREYAAHEAAEEERIYQLAKQGANFGVSRAQLVRVRKRLIREKLDDPLPPCTCLTNQLGPDYCLRCAA